MLRNACAVLLVMACGSSAAPRSAAPVVQQPDAAPAGPPAQDPRTATWCIREASDGDGNLVFLLINLEYRGYPHRAHFPNLVHVNITTKDQNPNGHPTSEEAEVLNRIEDAITASLGDSTATRFVGRATTRGFRELLDYVTDATKANEVLTRLGETSPRPWEFQISEDAQWAAVQPLLDDDSACL